MAKPTLDKAVQSCLTDPSLAIVAARHPYRSRAYVRVFMIAKTKRTQLARARHPMWVNLYSANGENGMKEKRFSGRTQHAARNAPPRHDRVDVLGVAYYAERDARRSHSASRRLPLVGGRAASASHWRSHAAGTPIRDASSNSTFIVVVDNPQTSFFFV